MSFGAEIIEFKSKGDNRPDGSVFLLRKIIALPSAHGRFLALLARLEYVGARKIAKALAAKDMRAEELEHWAEEVGHALVLRREAERLQGAESSDDYAFLDDGERYLQVLDAEIARILKESLGQQDTYTSYLVTSLIIEERAMKFYPRYHHELPPGSIKDALQAVIKDEVGHLEEMRRHCGQVLKDYLPVLDDCRCAETEIYEKYFLPLLSQLASNI